MSTNETFDSLTGLTLTAIHYGKNPDDNDALYFETSGGVFCMTHAQDCCEHVRIEEVHGDPADLVDVVVSLAEESERTATSDEVSEEGTWTLYRLVTAKGDLTIRWLGESNGYYAEGVDFLRVDSLPGTCTPWRVGGAS